MGKVAVLSLITFLIVGATRETQRRQTEFATEVRDGQSRFEILTRNAALLGVAQAERALTSSALSFGTIQATTGDLSGVSYTYKVTVAPVVVAGCTLAQDATIWSRGFGTDVTGSPVDYKAIKVIRKCNSTTFSVGTVPAFMSKALLVNQSIGLNGNILVDTFRVAGTLGPLAQRQHPHQRQADDQRQRGHDPGFWHARNGLQRAQYAVQALQPRGCGNRHERVCDLDPERLLDPRDDRRRHRQPRDGG